MSEDLLREYITESLSEAGVFSTLAKVTAATGKAWKKGEHVGNLLFQGDLSGALQAFLPDELKDKIAKLSSKEFSRDGGCLEAANVWRFNIPVACLFCHNRPVRPQNKQIKQSHNA